MKNLWRFLGWVVVCHALALGVGLLFLIGINLAPGPTTHSVVNGCACPDAIVPRQCSE